MRTLRTQPIRRQIVAVSGLLLLPIVLASLWSATATRRERSTEVLQEAATMAAASAASLDQLLRGLDALASALVRDASVVTLDRPANDRLFAAVLADHPSLLNIALHGPDGSVKGSAHSIETAGPIGAVAPPVQQVLTTGRGVVSELSVDSATHKATIFLVYPVSSGSRVVGALTLALDLIGLPSTSAAIPSSDGLIVTLMNGSGMVLARSREPERFIGTTVDMPTVNEPDAPPQMSRQTDGDGVERLVASAVVHRAPWVISAGIPTAVVAARVWPLWRRNLAIVAIAAVGSLLVSLWVGGRLARVLEDLRGSVVRIAAGDLSPVPVQPPLNLELAELQDAFGAMGESLRQAREALTRQGEEEHALREQFESLQLQVVRQERLAAVGVLVSGVAHELNNPLQAIMGAAELLERCGGLPDDALLEVAMVKTQSRRASEIIRNLSRFSTQQAPLPAVIDLGDVVAEVVQLRRADLESDHITCEVRTASTSLVRANFTEVEQVVLNFVINAQQAIQSSGVANGRVVIRTLDVGARVRLEVEDNGPGVPLDVEAKLFQPFFTTKPVGAGTGLGLSVSYGIVQSLGGAIGYRHNESGGATFFFDLPRVGAPIADAGLKNTTA